MTKPLSLLDRILFFLGMPKPAPAGAVCFKCKATYSLIDLGDGHIVCQPCWDSWVPSYDK